MHEKYKECPFKATGFKLIDLPELPPMIIGADDMCICVEGSHCMDVDKRDGLRCSLKQLKQLSDDAVRRRAWQSGEDW
jgi:hypothetical protein